ncbi:MAG: hypothetical protein IPJ75_13305 [Ignavibacteriales bacterium]|nr:hypothetical protein [Ignavibacteriales bacterium]
MNLLNVFFKKWFFPLAVLILIAGCDESRDCEPTSLHHSERKFNSSANADTGVALNQK